MVMGVYNPDLDKCVTLTGAGIWGLPLCPCVPWSRDSTVGSLHVTDAEVMGVTLTGAEGALDIGDSSDGP